MRRLIPFALIAVLAAGGLFHFYRTNAPGRYPAPDFILPDLQGHQHQLSQYQGQIVFLNLWTTWCPPCREEMPSMERLHRTYGRRGLVILAVSEDEGDSAGVEAFAKSLDLTFPILLDPSGRLPGRYGVTGYPETFLIDRRGKIVDHTIGPADWFSPAFRARIERMLAEPYDESGA